MACRVLFVDDDPDLLEALSRALRKQRGKWEMVFANGPEAALAQIGQAPFDVVVSDMRMPDIDGAQLLGRTRDKDPSIVRFILSGYSDGESLRRGIAVAHQLFSKPCDLGELRTAIDRAHEVRGLLDHEAVRRAIGKIAAIPSVPGVYHELAVLRAQRDASVDPVTAAIDRDPEIREEMSRLAGVYLGLDHPVAKVGAAVEHLGIDVVCGLALASHMFRTFAPAAPEAVAHAIAVAREARALADGPASPYEAFTAGLVHEIGELVIARAMPEEHAAIEQRSGGASRDQLERELLGTSHHEIAAYVLVQWGLPMSVVGAVAQHESDPPPTPLAATLRAAHASAQR